MSERVYLSFDRHEDSESLSDALKASRYKSFIDEFDQRVFRRILKYGDTDGFDVNSIDVLDPYKVDILMNFTEKFRDLYWKIYDEVVRDEV